MSAKGGVLPTGTVTFLFTDIEGSTRLWQADATAMHRAVEHHFSLLDAAVTEHGGTAFKRVGDAVQAAFWGAPAAIAAAVDAQRSLAAADWGMFALPHDARLAVRMALHSGDAAPDERGDYLAACLNRLARLLGTAHGGQILVTDLTRRLASEVSGPELGTLDLGTHRLRDIGDPEHIHQVTAPGLPSDFPPLRVAATRTALPAPAGPLVNRTRELSIANELLATAHTTILTLTGPGGVGKTRLALELGRLRGAEGGDVAFVSLGAVVDPEQVPGAVAAALGVAPTAGASLDAAIANEIATRRLLLILDNCEQVISVASWVAGLVSSAPLLQLLATSREPLGLSGERELPLPPLDPSPAVELFLQSARRIRPDFEPNAGGMADVERICAALDGLPLAVELAAARVRTMNPGTIARELGERARSLDLLTGGTRTGPDRHRTLRATIGWSFDLLEPREASLFTLLGVFGRSFSADAVAQVASRMGSLAPGAGAEARNGADEWHAVLDGLDSLVQKSLVVPDEGASYVPRFRMLAALRAYALERLEAEEAGPVRARDAHLAVYRERAEVAAGDYLGTSQADAVEQVHADLDNYRVAFAWARERQASAQALAMASSLARIFLLLGLAEEGLANLSEALDSAGDEVEGTLLGDACNGAGFLAWAVGRRDDARHWLSRALVVRRLSGDPEAVARTLNNLGILTLEGGEVDEAAGMYAEALSLLDRPEHAFVRSGILLSLGVLEGERLNDEAAQAYLEESLQLKQSLGDREGEAAALTNLGVLADRRGDRAGALELAERALGIQRSLGDRAGAAASLGLTATALAGLGRHGEARDALHESLAIRRDIGDLHGQLRGLWVASAQAADSEPERASGWLGAADEARRSAAIERSRADDALVGAIQSALRARLGEGEYDRAVEEGTRTRLAAAMADALEWSAGGGPSQPAAGRR